MSSRAQIDRIFIFILALFVIAGSVFLGMKVISSVLPKNQDMEFNRFKSDVTEALGSLEYGASKGISISVPAMVSRICFFDGSDSDEKRANPQAYDWDSPKMREMAASGDNTFFLQKESIVGRTKIRGLRIADKYVKCFDASTGYLQLTIQGGEYGTVVI